jgi:hypothetical protein
MLMTRHFDAGITCQAFGEHGQNTEIRLDRILEIRRQLTSGEYDLTEHLDIAMDRLLEEILEEPPENHA